MKIAVIGASAGVGLLCVQQALHKKHTIISLSRTIDGLPENAGLICIQGSTINVGDIKKTIANADAAIVAIGTGKSTKATTLYSDAAAAIIEAQKELKKDIPFIILTGFGAGNSSRYQSFFMKIIFRLLLNSVYKNKTKMEEMIAASDIRWEIVWPGMLTDKAFTGKYRIETKYKKGMNIGSIPRADVADFLIKQTGYLTAPGMYPALSGK